MKTPKVATPKPKLKFNTPKSGLVRKSLGNNSAASLKKLTTKGKEQVLFMVKDNVEFKGKTPKKARMSLPANALRDSKSSPANGGEAKTPKKSPQTKKGAVPESPNSGKKNTPTNKTPAKGSPATKPQNFKKTPQIKNVQQNVSTPASVENNTSPIKQNVESKKSKVPFNLDDSLANGTPEKPKQKKGTPPGKAGPKSPEVELGLQLEEALSPKSKKKMALGVKVAADGKVAVNKVVEKLNVTTSNSSPDSKKKKRKRNRKGSNKSAVKREHKPSFLKHINATKAVNALLKVSEPQKGNLLEGDDYIFLQFSLLKQSKDPRGVYKVVLPHSILPDTSEVCLVVPDLKGKQNEPEEAIEHYTALLKSKGITSITEIIPLRKLKQDYSQFEERRKLTNRFDCIISDGRVTNVAQLGKRFARAKKCIFPVNFGTKTLKEDIEKSLRKVAIFSSGQGSSFSVKCGRRGMPAEDIADNIVAIGEFLANNETMIGEPLNVSVVVIKMARSTSFPVFTSTLTPNDVKTPKDKTQKTEEPVEGEVTTVPDGTVVVYPSGNVKVKKRKNEEDQDDGVKQKDNKKAKTNVSKKVKVEADDEEQEESDSDVDMNSLSDDDSAVDSLNGTDDEASDDESEIEDDDDDEEDGDDDDDVDDDDKSIDEEELEASEKAYLEELRLLQKEMGKKKGKKSERIANIVEKKEEQAKQQNKNAATKGAKKQEKKGLQNEQKQTKKDILKEQDTNAKGKKVDKQNQVKESQNNLPKKKQVASPKNQQKGNQNQKKNKFGSPQNQQKGKVEQFAKGKGPNKRNAQKGGSPMHGKKQFKKGPGAKNKN